jgi:hypothetical protein
MLLLASVFLAGLAASGGTPPPLEHLTIHVSDSAPVPPKTFQNAISMSQRIFLKPGIETHWSSCRPGESSFVQPKEVPICIIARSLDPKHVDARPLGYVVRSKERGYTINLFYDHIGRKAVGNPSVLLGMVMTHEIGHFFGLDHVFCGIMLEGFAPTHQMQAAVGSLMFSEGQETALRRAIAKWNLR